MGMCSMWVGRVVLVLCCAEWDAKEEDSNLYKQQMSSTPIVRGKNKSVGRSVGQSVSGHLGPALRPPSNLTFSLPANWYRAQPFQPRSGLGTAGASQASRDSRYLSLEICALSSRPSRLILTGISRPLPTVQDSSLKLRCW